uniref:Uncharacterized protein n=1 Tax=Gossypium raimondii TaxID=29730 RepID=A0A0D2TQF0_GOSRA|nr:hypothetical protein B456_012G160000 [Gossypium raimondii]
MDQALNRAGGKSGNKEAICFYSTQYIEWQISRNYLVNRFLSFHKITQILLGIWTNFIKKKHIKLILKSSNNNLLRVDSFRRSFLSVIRRAIDRTLNNERYCFR